MDFRNFQESASGKQSIKKYKRHRSGNSISSVFSGGSGAADDDLSFPFLDVATTKTDTDHSSSIKPNDQINLVAVNSNGSFVESFFAPIQDSGQDFGNFVTRESVAENSSIIDMYAETQAIPIKENESDSNIPSIISPNKNNNSPGLNSYPTTNTTLVFSEYLPLNLDETAKSFSEMSVTDVEGKNFNSNPMFYIHESESNGSSTFLREPAKRRNSTMRSIFDRKSFSIDPPSPLQKSEENKEEFSQSQSSIQLLSPNPFSALNHTENSFESIVSLIWGPGSCHRNQDFVKYIFNHGLRLATFTDCKMKVVVRETEASPIVEERSVHSLHRLLLLQSPILQRLIQSSSNFISMGSFFCLSYDQGSSLITVSILVGSFQEPKKKIQAIQLIEKAVLFGIQGLYGVNQFVESPENIVSSLVASILFDLDQMRSVCYARSYVHFQRLRQSIKDSPATKASILLKVLEETDLSQEIFGSHQTSLRQLSSLVDCIDYFFLHSWHTSWFRFCIAPFIPKRMLERLVSQWFLLEGNESKRYNNLLRLITLRYAHILHGNKSKSIEEQEQGDQVDTWLLEYWQSYENRFSDMEYFKGRFTDYRNLLKSGILGKDANTMYLVDLICRSVNLDQLDLDLLRKNPCDCVILESRAALKYRNGPGSTKGDQKYHFIFDFSHYDSRQWDDILSKDDFILTPEPVAIGSSQALFQLFIRKMDSKTISQEQDDDATTDTKTPLMMYGIFLKRTVLASEKGRLEDLPEVKVKFQIFLSHSLGDMEDWTHDEGNLLLSKGIHETGEQSLKPLESMAWISDAIRHSLVKSRSERKWIAIKVQVSNIN